MTQWRNGWGAVEGVGRLYEDEVDAVALDEGWRGGGGEETVERVGGDGIGEEGGELGRAVWKEAEE